MSLVSQCRFIVVAVDWRNGEGKTKQASDGGLMGLIRGGWGTWGMV